ncbi:hypothetical protein ACFQFH_19560 [Halobaculum halobium]
MGDRFATNVTAVTGGDRVEGELSRFARTVGRIRTVTLPDEIADIDGYDPVDDDTKELLAGETLLFPKRLSGEALHEALLTRLKEEYDVGHTDAEFDGDSVTHLGIGRRIAGIGPTLGPGTRAVAIRADPPTGAVRETSYRCGASRSRPLPLRRSPRRPTTAPRRHSRRARPNGSRPGNCVPVPATW